jgi:hypothetical protein
MFLDIASVVLNKAMSKHSFELADRSRLICFDLRRLDNFVNGIAPADAYAVNAVVAPVQSETSQNVIATAWQPNTV